MTTLLITMYLPEERAGILDHLTTCALASLSVCGIEHHEDLGGFRHHGGKNKGADILKLITVTLAPAPNRDDAELARNIESALRTNLKTACVPPNDRVRVLIGVTADREEAGS